MDIRDLELLQTTLQSWSKYFGILQCFSTGTSLVYGT